jgi:ubiquinone/menaquinone biosynthesis C-methylase UbiE
MAGGPILDTARWYDPIFAGVLGGIRELATRMAPSGQGMNMLDVGCGTGRQLAHYQDKGGELFGIDISTQMLNVAKSNLKGEVGLVNGDALQLPYSMATFDLVTSSLFLHQLSAEKRLIVLDEIIRVLKPDGQILLIDFHPYSTHTIIGTLTYLSIAIIEFFAGWEHFSNSRQFLSHGGIPKLTYGQELVLRKSKVVGNGNLGIYLLGLD